MITLRKTVPIHPRKNHVRVHALFHDLGLDCYCQEDIEILFCNCLPRICIEIALFRVNSFKEIWLVKSICKQPASLHDWWNVQ